MQSLADASILSKVEEFLEEIVRRESSILSAAVLTADGLPLVLLMGKGEIEKLELSAAIASLGSLSEQTANRLGIGAYKDLMLRCTRGHLLIRLIGHGNMLAVLADQNAQLGAITLILDSASKRLKSMLK